MRQVAKQCSLVQAWAHWSGAGLTRRGVCPRPRGAANAAPAATASSFAALAETGFTVAKLGAAATVQNMEAVAMQLMNIAPGAAGSYNGKGGVSRRSIGGTGFVNAAAGAPPEIGVEFHNEMAYASSYPKFVTFAMVRQAPKDGTTLLVDNIEVQGRMSPSLLAKFEELGVRYVRYLHDQAEEGSPDFFNSWQGAFQASTIQEAFAKGNNRENFSVVEWHTDGRRLRHTLWCPVFHEHPEHGRLFFNSVLNRHGSWLDEHSFFGTLPLSERPYHCLWGDGEEFSEAEIHEIREAHQQSTVSVKLNPGDVLVMDNLRIAHGRTSYEGDRLLGLLLSDLVDRAPCQAPESFVAFMDRRFPE